MTNLLWGIENVSFFDSYWATVHFVANIPFGLFLCFVLTRQKKEKYFFLIGISTMILWELFELILRYIDKVEPQTALSIQKVIPKTFFLVESPLNIASDLILGFLGQLIAYFLWKKLVSKTQDSPR